MAGIPSDIARLVVRVGVGGVLAYDGTQKVMAWYRGRQVAATGVGPTPSGTPTRRTVGLAAGASEAIGGAMLILGIATPATGAAAASTMALTATAAAQDDGKRSPLFTDGFEVPAVLGVCAAALALAGPGRISIDHLLGNRLSNRPAALASLFATASSTALVVLRRQRSR